MMWYDDHHMTRMTEKNIIFENNQKAGWAPSQDQTKVVAEKDPKPNLKTQLDVPNHTNLEIVWEINVRNIRCVHKSFTMVSNNERKTPRLGVEAYWNIFFKIYSEDIRTLWQTAPSSSSPSSSLCLSYSRILSQDNFLRHLSDQHGAVCRVDRGANTGEHSATDEEWQALNVMINLGEKEENEENNNLDHFQPWGKSYCKPSNESRATEKQNCAPRTKSGGGFFFFKICFFEPPSSTVATQQSPQDHTKIQTTGWKSNFRFKAASKKRTLPNQVRSSKEASTTGRLKEELHSWFCLIK